MAKRIGGGRGPAKQVEFELVVYRGNEEETRSFQALLRKLPAELLQVMARVEKDPENAVEPLVKMLTKVMDDKDGVPSSWKPVRIDQDDPSIEVGGLKDVPCYRDHEGTVHAFRDNDMLTKLQSVEAGSSRRRWLHLMNEDDEVTIEVEDLLALAEYLISEAGDRPTGPRA